jgi:hypothetical protein
MLEYKKDALFVFLLLALTFAYFYQDPGANGNSRIGLTLAAIQESRLTIDSFYNKEGVRTVDKASFNGHYYSDKAIGVSLLAAIVYLPMFWISILLKYNFSLFVIKYSFTFFVVGLPSAFAGSLIYVYCKYISGSPTRAFIVTLAISLGTMIMPYSIIFFSHSLTAALLFIAFFLIFKLKVRPEVGKKGYLILIGFLLGLALITEYTTVIVVIPLVLYYFYVFGKYGVFRRFSTLVSPALGGLIPLSTLLIYNTLVFGSPLAIGYEYLYDPEYGSSMAEGLMGIGRPHPTIVMFTTVHPAEGLFWQSPVLIMAIIGAFFMFRDRRYRPEALITTVAFLGFLIMDSGYFMWWGGFAFGPRHIIPMLPFLCLPLIFVPRRLFFLVAILGLFSIGQMFIVAASEILVPDDWIRKISKLNWFQFSTIYSYCLKQLLEGNFAWNLGSQLLGLKNWISLLPISAVILGSSGIFLTLKPGEAEISSSES